MRVFDLAAGPLSQTLVDIRPKLILATRPLGPSATRPRRHVSFLDKPFFWWTFLRLNFKTKFFFLEDLILDLNILLGILGVQDFLFVKI